MKLVNVKIHKYKSFDNEQSFNVDPLITILVGKNESGKTASLEAIAKTNYFSGDAEFKFNATHDYPRKEKKAYDKSGVIGGVITCDYQLSKEMISEIENDLGKNVLTTDIFSVTTKFDNSRSITYPEIDKKAFFEFISSKFDLKDEKLKLDALTDKASIEEMLVAENKSYQDAKTDETTKANAESRQPVDLPQPKIISALTEIKKYFVDLDWENWLAAYLWITYLKDNLPKLMYFDEYYELPARLNINEVASAKELTTQELKTAKALFELADIDLNELSSATSFEDFVAELEATSSQITQHIFNYWTNNTGLRVQFHIEHSGTEKFLNIRVWNDKHHISLPLSNRSKGFNWFFSFIVWFSRIQEDKDNNYILLLDEPGLNLHASAQHDLLRFLEDLCGEYQIIYTTHSPFMVPSENLQRIRTVYEGKNGSVISDAIQEKDADTLFPLQAALGYDIAQNLFISKNNLLVEGPSDLIYLTLMSSLLESEKRTGLSEDITIVPVGGLDKVTSFISLLRGQKLNIACILDTFTDQKGKKRLEDLIMLKIINQKDVLFFDEFDDLDGDIADLEDLYTKEEYLEFFNKAFEEHNDIKVGDLTDVKRPIIPQINKLISKSRYNHYRPANYANGLGLASKDFSKETLDRFENLFKAINARFS